MSGEKLVFVYDQSGSMKIDAIGFKGKACEVATKKFLAARNATSTDVKRKPEYNQIETGASATIKI